mgnify:CR=1 FL=1
MSIEYFGFFQGIGTMFEQSPSIVVARIVLIFVGFLLTYLGVKGTLEPLIMVPMGLGMSAVNAGMLFLENNEIGNLIIDPLLSETDELMKFLQIDFLQPLYTFTFSNGLIACLVFMGIGICVTLDMFLEHPFYKYDDRAVCGGRYDTDLSDRYSDGT